MGAKPEGWRMALIDVGHVLKPHFELVDHYPLQPKGRATFSGIVLGYYIVENVKRDE
jgi:hypothetical protein